MGDVGGPTGLSRWAQRIAHIRSPGGQPQRVAGRSPLDTSRGRGVGAVVDGSGGGDTVGWAGAGVTVGAVATGALSLGAAVGVVAMAGVSGSTHARSTQIRSPLQSASLPQPDACGVGAGEQAARQMAKQTTRTRGA